jgi:hypothetical protein
MTVVPTHPTILFLCPYAITAQIRYFGIWVIRIAEEIKFLMLPSNRLLVTSRLAIVGRAYPRKHIRGNPRYLVTWNTWRFSVGYFPKLDKFATYRTPVTVSERQSQYVNDIRRVAVYDVTVCRSVDE